MQRRSFFKKTIAAGSGLILGGGFYSEAKEIINIKEQIFNLHYAPHLEMFKSVVGDNPIDQLQFMASQGFTAFEDNNMKDRDVDLQNEIAETLKTNNMIMGVFVAHTIGWKEPNLASGNKEKREEFLDEIKSSIQVAKRLGAKWMTVVPGAIDPKLAFEYQTANVVESLKAASEIIEPHNLIMVLEPLNFRDHPGMFLNESPQAYQICKAVDSPSCKILFDIYHQQIQEGNLIPNIDKCWDEIAYFQVGDNPGRNEPGTGEINYRNIFKHIYSKGFNGLVGMEHGNSIIGEEGAFAVINAYKDADNF
ncbi:hydroxypyruvate isomerase family protein [Christiangramia crocea]|uniref:TIM barrel protein n=1 Tax=Christiangramia crocea TaxID=2904124 RepID=A0A9X1UYL6_9FLAO|nr:TIM barrel protein [Gramella crocea]MCG9972535.1 TIM barrel protein [Gramella crocea]